MGCMHVSAATRLEIPISDSLRGKVKFSGSHISVMEGVHRKSTADLDSGRRPDLKNAKIFLWTLSITEIFAILVEIERRH